MHVSLVILNGAHISTKQYATESVNRKTDSFSFGKIVNNSLPVPETNDVDVVILIVINFDKNIIQVHRYILTLLLKSNMRFTLILYNCTILNKYNGYTLASCIL